MNWCALSEEGGEGGEISLLHMIWGVRIYHLSGVMNHLSGMPSLLVMYSRQLSVRFCIQRPFRYVIMLIRVQDSDRNMITQRKFRRDLKLLR